MSYLVTYSGVTDQSVGCHAKTRPSVPAPVRDVAVTRIAGRDSGFYDADRTFADIAIPITFSFSDRNPDRWAGIYRAVKAWLLSGDNGNLYFSDDPGYHYRVRNVVITSTERVTRRIGEVTATFYCEGYQYLDSGDTQINLSSTVYNDYSLCKPTYSISGTGSCTLTVNGKKMVMTVSRSIVIDTERMIATSAGNWVNTTVTGDYEDLWLKPGANSLSISSGFTCRITPYWRCL